MRLFLRLTNASLKPRRKSVFPATKEERDTLAAQKKEAEGAAAAKNYELAARIAKQYKQEKLEVNQKDLEFELVCKCEKDAKAAHAMEMMASPPHNGVP